MCKAITVNEAIRQLNRYDCEFYIPANRMAHRMAIAAIKEQEERNNPKELTREELMEMNGQPVYVVNKYNGATFWDVISMAGEWGILMTSYLIPCFGKSRGVTHWDEFNENFIAYRYKPSEEFLESLPYMD